CDFGCSDGPLFEAEAIRVGFDVDVTGVAVTNLELVEFTDTETGDEDFPDAAGAVDAHRMHTAVPLVEIADHTYAFCIGCPYRKTYPVDALLLDQVRPKSLVRLQQAALAEQVNFIAGQTGWE